MVKVRRGTEAGDAPGWQGATRLRQGYGAPKFAGKAIRELDVRALVIIAGVNDTRRLR